MQSYFVGQIIWNFNVNKIVNLVYIFTLKMTEIQKTPGEAKEQENADESSWKLPVIINTSSLGRAKYNHKRFLLLLNRYLDN